MTRLLLLTILAAAALAGAVTAAQAQVRIGIGDQKPSMFADPRFTALEIRHARLSVGYDAASSAWQRAEIDAWMAAARAANVEPLVTFGHSRLPRKRHYLPTVKEFTREFRRFRARWPDVRNYATWNEANLCGEPTCRAIPRVVKFWNVIRRNCKGCKVLAAEMLDFPNMRHWITEFERIAKTEPRYWGLHNYRDANRMVTENTRTMLRNTSGEIWLTETGGIVKRRNKSSVFFEESESHAGKSTRWLFDRIVPLSPRITRVYLYNWNNPEDNMTWDTALIGPGGKERPAFRVLQDEMAGLRRRAQTPAVAPLPR